MSELNGFEGSQYAPRIMVLAALARFIQTGQFSNDSELIQSGATKIVVSDSDGEWHMPLGSTLEVTSSADAVAMSASPPDTAIDMGDSPSEAHLYIRWIGTDNIYQEVRVDTGRAHYIPAE